MKKPATKFLWTCALLVGLLLGTTASHAADLGGKGPLSTSVAQVD